MKLAQLPSLILALVLRLMPLSRTGGASSLFVPGTFTVILKWTLGAAVVLGGYHAVSGASTVITSPTTALGTNGVPFSYRITTGPQVANTFNAAPLPPGLTVSTTTGKITGTPTQSGFWTVLLTASDSGIPDRTITTNLALTIVNGGGGGTAPTITTQPTNQTVTAGGTATFSVVASGTAPLSYRWRLNNTNLPSGTNASLTLTSVTSNQAGGYIVVVTNSYGSVTSAVATLTVNPAPIPPSIATQPLSQTVTAGANVTFSVVAAGTSPLSYQWRKGGINLGGATNANLLLTTVTTNQAGGYTVVVSNPAGSVTSAVATLTVNLAPIPPSITAQPLSQTVIAGTNVTLTVVAIGTAPLSYQWRKDGVDLPGATNATLLLAGVTPSQAGNYTVIVTGSAGSVTSQPAVLTVHLRPSPPYNLRQTAAHMPHGGPALAHSKCALPVFPFAEPLPPRQVFWQRHSERRPEFLYSLTPAGHWRMRAADFLFAC